MSDCTHDCSSCGESCAQRESKPEDFLVKLSKGSSVKKVIGVVSGKGGVGKSMVTSLLAAASMREGFKTAILDGDITGPSIPKAFGLSMNLGPLLEWGLGFSKNHIAIDPTTAATNVEGVFAIGDVATYEHKQKLILCGFAQAAQAAHSIRRMLYPNEVVHFEYSTTKGVPQEEKTKQSSAA